MDDKAALRGIGTGVWVPMEPTRSMLSAFYGEMTTAIEDGGEAAFNCVRDGYKAMLSAASDEQGPEAAEASSNGVLDPCSGLAKQSSGHPPASPPNAAPQMPDTARSGTDDEGAVERVTAPVRPSLGTTSAVSAPGKPVGYVTKATLDWITYGPGVSGAIYGAADASHEIALYLAAPAAHAAEPDAYLVEYYELSKSGEKRHCWMASLEPHEPLTFYSDERIESRTLISAKPLYLAEYLPSPSYEAGLREAARICDAHKDQYGTDAVKFAIVAVLNEIYAAIPTETGATK